MGSNLDFEFSAKVWLWVAEKAAWHFLTIPECISNEIYFAHKLDNFGKRRGFGAIKVEVIIGKTIFFTSLFPNSKENTYLLPIKSQVRKAENINAGDEIALKVRIL